MATINGTAAAEILNSGVAADRLNGLGGDDTLNGGGGNDTLDGGTGSDSMKGGTGDDIYFADATTDKSIELADQGIDTVRSSVTYTLPVNVEKLILIGTGNINGTGNTLANTLTGNTGANNLSGLGGADTVNGGAGADTLDGGTGADSLVGGAGNDLLIWDALDVKVNGGADTDTLRVTGTTALNLTAVPNTKIVNVEVISLAGTNALTLNAADVLAISSTTDTLRVAGARAMR